MLPICKMPMMTCPNTLHWCHDILKPSCFTKILYQMPLMVVFILLHWLSSSHQVSKLWTKRNLGDYWVSSLPAHFQVWFTEIRRSLVICPGSTFGWWNSQGWLRPWSLGSPATGIGLTVPLINDLAWCSDTCFRITHSQQLRECIASRHLKSRHKKSKNLYMELWTN